MKKAFTLAEVLITLGIIGVVAAMTLPTLIQKQQEKTTVVRLQKVYSILQQAHTLAVSKDGEPDGWGTSISGINPDGSYEPTGAINISNVYSKYLKLAKNCGKKPGCFALESIGNRTNLAKVVLVDGTSVAFGGVNENCKLINGQSRELSNICGWVIVDINGTKKPNVYGVDIFEFYLTKYGLLPYGVPEDERYPFRTSCSSSSPSNGCTAWVLYNENLDYLHCRDLSWNGKKKCK